MNEFLSAKAVERAEASDNAYGVSGLGRINSYITLLNADDPKKSRSQVARTKYEGEAH